MQRPEKSLQLVALAAAALYVALMAGSARAQSTEPWYRQAFDGAFMGGQTPMMDLSQYPWLKGLSITGFGLNTTGMWVNSQNLRGLQNLNHSAGIPVSTSLNSLATERNLLQVDINYRLDSNNQFFLRWWGVYEPPYDYESGAGFEDLYNQYTVRDAWWKNKTGPLTLFIGRQIVTWGESIAFRVGDVVNTQDFEWNFGFANLEQSRLPMYMVHPILQLPNTGPFTSNFLEALWIPSFQPIYTNSPTDWGGTSLFAGQKLTGASVSLIAPPVGGRFSGYYGPTVGPGLGPSGATCPVSAQGCRPDWPQLVNPSPSLTFDNYALPSNNLANSEEGFRLHSVVKNTEMTAIFFHGHQYTPNWFLYGNPVGGYKQNFIVRYPQLNDIGITANRPLYLPGVLGNVPFVLRTEGVWQDRTPFMTRNPAVPSAIQYSSTLNTLVALDIDSYYASWLSSTGAATANLEWQNYMIMSPSRYMVYPFTPEQQRHNEDNILLNLTDSWHWGSIIPDLVGIYNPDGNTFLLFPNIVLVPPWSTKYNLLLEYIGILSNDVMASYAGGGFKGKSMFLMEFQYNFSVVAASD
jgi:hypothetical protein